jgi:hypothetical protein
LTAVEVLRRASETGLTVFVRGTDHVVVRGHVDAIEILKYELAAHKPEIVALLREHGGTTATDAVLTAQRLLRDGWCPETSSEDCSFFTGHPTDAVCKCCNSSWLQHTIRATDGMC